MISVAMQRAVDRWVGVPICVVLTALARLSRRRGAPQGLRRLLFVKLAEQGSTVLAANALNRAIEMVGRDNVFFLAFAENRFILDAMGLLPAANVLTIEVHSLPAAAWSALGAVRRLRALHLDAALDLEFFARSSAIFAYLSGARMRVGLHSFAGEGPYRGDLMTHRLLYNPYLLTSEMFLQLVDALDQPPGRFPAYGKPRAAAAPVPCTHTPAVEDLDAMRALVRTSGCQPDAPIVLLNANGSDLLPLRRWDRTRYVELASRLLAARPDVHVMFTGSPAERADAEQLARDVASPRCASVAGKTSLRELLALYSLSRVLVTNDSGPAHFASITPINVVTLFGPETPALFAARTPRNQALWAGLVCSPCVNAYNNRLSRCRDNLCMQSIGVDEVLDATLRALAAR